MSLRGTHIASQRIWRHVVGGFFVKAVQARHLSGPQLTSTFAGIAKYGGNYEHSCLDKK